MLKRIPKISVVMTVYNSEKFVKQAIDSVLGQSYNDFEFIIVDDGSVDNSLNIIQEYDDPRIRILVNEKNSGICYSSNRGISEATGEYIARIDSDDICHKDRFRVQVDFLDSHREIFMCGTWRNLLYSDGKIIESNVSVTKNNEIGFMLLFGNPMITHSTVMFRREEYNRKGYSYERFVQAHDYKLWTQFIMDNKKIEIIPKRLLDYRINESGITATNTQVRNKIEADTIKKEYVMGMELDEKSKKTLLEYIDGSQIESYYRDFESAILAWAELFYTNIKERNSDGYFAVKQMLWHVINRQECFSMKLLKDYCDSIYFDKDKLLFSKEGLKLIIKCFLKKGI